MKYLITLIITAFINISAMAQYKPIANGSSVAFKISNLGFDIKGSFTGIQGTINFDPKMPENSNMDVTIDASTINTDNNLRDSHLKNEDYFDVKTYPVIHFVSTKISQTGKTGYAVAGKLTIKGKSKDLIIPFTATPATDGYLFKGSFKINRKDFGIGGISTIANELEVLLTVSASKA